MSERAETLLGRLEPMLRTGNGANKTYKAEAIARAICEHLGLAHEVKRAMAAAVMRLDDPDQEVQQRASTGVAAIVTLLEAAGVER